MRFMSELVLTHDQKTAYEAFKTFIVNPKEHVFILKGYAGTGKSRLVKEFLEVIPKCVSTLKLLSSDKFIEPEILVTATTNKAVDALRDKVQQDVVTIYSALGLRVQYNSKENKSCLIKGENHQILNDKIIFIDEAGTLSPVDLRLLWDSTDKCKIIFIGDPAQLLPITYAYSPVFVTGFPTYELKEVVRQKEGNPIIDLATAFRDVINGGQFFSFVPDGHYIQHLPRIAFEAACIKEFSRPDWKHNDSKILAWRNTTVIAYNKGLREHIVGSPEFQEGDYAVCNKYMSFRNGRIKTDQSVHISLIGYEVFAYGIPGYKVLIDNTYISFLPKDWQAAKNKRKQAEKDGDFCTVSDIDNTWIDLRAMYACTINKSQGSTYDKVFIDLDDIKQCRNPNMIARLLYVGVTRARHQVIFTGDLV
jgi:hypothetical protein